MRIARSCPLQVAVALAEHRGCGTETDAPVARITMIR
jgi:hypothetical protein